MLRSNLWFYINGNKCGNVLKCLPQQYSTICNICRGQNRSYVCKLLQGFWLRPHFGLHTLPMVSASLTQLYLAISSHGTFNASDLSNCLLAKSSILMQKYFLVKHCKASGSHHKFCSRAADFIPLPLPSWNWIILRYLDIPFHPEQIFPLFIHRP